MTAARQDPTDARCAQLRPAPRAQGHSHAHGHDHGHGDDHTHGHAHGDAHGHTHGPGHTHRHGEGASTRALKIALALTATLLVAEAVGGWLANSLALLADAGHMLTDVAALGLSLFVAWFSRQPSTPKKTYGYLRWEILAALINGATLLGISVVILWEAVQRLRAPEAVAGGTMLVIAVLGLVVNLVAAWVLHGSAGESLNHRGAYLHVLGDLLASVGTVIAAILIRGTGWLPIDPIASIITTLLVVRSAWNLVRESVDILLEAAPAHLEVDDVRERLSAVPGVASVHDLHVWSVNSGVVAMSAHAVVPDLARHDAALVAIDGAMRDMGIGHVTIQLERTAMRPCMGHVAV